MLPENIPTVTVTGRYLTPEGHPVSGSVEFRPPSMLTHAESDLILGGPSVAPLDAEGRLSIELPATDAAGWNPAEWTYTVTEQLTGVGTRRVYQIVLPQAVPTVDLADISPVDPGTPDYVAVPGPPGPAGESGPPGPAGEPGLVRSVNGVSEPEITLTAQDVSAVPAAAVGTAGGVAALDSGGRVPAAQLPEGTGGGVTSVNEMTGAVVLDAAAVGALDQEAADARYLRPAEAPVRSVNDRTGDVVLTPGTIGAARADEVVKLAGAQTIESAKVFTTPPATGA
ncbi:phage tail protein, partial [Streptomyces sp. SB3404]|nr:phage tail protein [Streptomyces boncukensis]